MSDAPPPDRLRLDDERVWLARINALYSITNTEIWGPVLMLLIPLLLLAVLVIVGMVK